MNQPAYPFTAAELEAYLDEALDSEKAAEIERALRENPKLLSSLKGINARRDSGVHTVGEIWRRQQLGVPTREELGSFLLGILDEEHADYIQFRLDVLKCPYTIANLNDLQQETETAADEKQHRKRKYLNSTSAYFSNEGKKP